MTILLDKQDIDDVIERKPLVYFSFSVFEDDIYKIIEMCVENEHPFARKIIRAGERFSCVVETQLNGGILIRPYRKDLDYYITDITE